MSRGLFFSKRNGKPLKDFKQGVHEPWSDKSINKIDLSGCNVDNQLQWQKEEGMWGVVESLLQ